jgi:hypothetical protein
MKPRPAHPGPIRPKFIREGRLTPVPYFLPGTGVFRRWCWYRFRFVEMLVSPGQEPDREPSGLPKITGAKAKCSGCGRYHRLFDMSGLVEVRES